MAETLIATRLPEVISNRPAGNTAEPEKPLFSDFQGYFRGHEDGGQVDIAGGPGLWTAGAGVVERGGLETRITRY
jgi:hypothetical protein